MGEYPQGDETMNWLELTGRILASFFVLLVMTRLMGKKQLSHLTFFHYITGITIGSVAASLTTDSRLPILQGIYSLVMWGGLTILMGYVALKATWIRAITEGRPAILIRKGKLDTKALTRAMLSLDDLNMMLRTAGTFETSEVEYAILEPNGQLSVLKKEECKTVTRKDLNVSVQAAKNLPAVVIATGRIMEKNLKSLGLDEVWLEKEVRKQGYKRIEDIFFAEVGSDGGLFIMPVVEE
jgi:uncharacterized membrane protein YcaP (DUF421 family)